MGAGDSTALALAFAAVVLGADLGFVDGVGFCFTTSLNKHSNQDCVDGSGEMR